MRHFSGWAFISFPLTNKRSVKCGVIFADNDLNTGVEGRKLHQIGCRITLIQQICKGWGFLFYFNTNISSSLTYQLGIEDIILNGTLQVIKKKSEKFSYRFGVLGTSRFGSPWVFATLPLGDAFTFLLAHAERHLLQAERALQAV